MSTDKDKVTRKLKAILSADVKGYSLLMANDEAYTIKKLEAYRDSMAELIRSHSGRVVDAVGDNLLAEFSSVVDAVRCSVEIQRDLQQKNADLSADKRLEFRIGVNIGDVIQEGDRIYGNGVNVAARIEGLADAGGICISRNAYGQIRDKLELGYEYLGDHSVKNIKQPVRVYKVLMNPEDTGKLIGDVPKPVTKKWIWATAVLATIVITTAVSLVYQKMTVPDFEPAKIEEMAYPLPEKPSIAVLPFRNMSGDPAKEYIANGLTENIITNLAKLPEVFVISRESSFYYKGKTTKIKTVSEELGVRYVLEGSIIVESDNIRVTAQLIDAISGHHVWAQNYDRDLEGLLILLDDITLSILKEMQVDIKVGYKELGAGTKNINAYLKVVEGRYLSLLNIKEENLKARKLFKEAIKLDPIYAYAYTYLGLTYLNEANWMWSENPRKSMKMAVELFQKSIAINENYWPNHTSIAFCYFRHDPDKAIAESRKALELAPGAGLAYVYHAKFLRFAGKENSEFITEIAEKGRRLSPYLPALARFDLCATYFNSGNYSEVIALAESLLKENFLPDRVLALLVFVYLEKGEIEKAKFYAKKLMEVNPNFQVLGFLNWEAIKLSTDANDLVEPVKHILYPEVEQFITFSYDKKPEFNFTYPSSYKEYRKVHTDMILSLLTPKYGSCSIIMTRLTQNQTLDNFWETYIEKFIANFGSEFEIKMIKSIIFDCGTEGRLLDVNWRFQNGTYWTNRFVYAFHSGYGVVASIMRPVDEDDDLSWINQSLTFEVAEPLAKEPPKPSIAVLPFDNLSDDPEQGYLADGLTDELIGDLAKIEGIFVISRNSTFTYKGKDIKIPEVAKELNVRYVLEGSVQRAGNRLRIRAQLIDGKTDHHVWAESYDGDGTVENIFDFQDEITGKIVAALAVKLSSDEQKRISSRGTDNHLAYEAFLKGKDHYNKMTPDDLIEAAVYFEQAIKIDPNYSCAYAMLGMTYNSAWDFGFNEFFKKFKITMYNTARLKAIHYLKLAMRNPTYEAYSFATEVERDLRHFKKMIHYAEKAISIAPNAADANLLLGRMFLWSSRPEKAIEYCNIAVQLDPNSIDTFAEATITIGNAHFHLGHYEQAVEFIEKALAIKPKMRKLYSNDLAASYALLGQNNEAKKALEDYLKYWPIGTYPSLQDIYGWNPFKSEEVFDRFAKGLVKAGLPLDPSDYVKLVEKNKLTVEEAAELFGGHTITGIMSGNHWWREIDKQGNIRLSYIISGKKYSNKGKSWIENDMSCSQVENLWGGYTNCGDFYRNPDGDAETKNEYLILDYSGLNSFSIID